MNAAALLALASSLECWAATVHQTAPSLAGTREAAGVPVMLAHLERAEALLRSDASLNALRGVRARTHRFIGHPAHPGAGLMAEATVWLHRRAEFFGPQCTLRRGADYTHHAALGVHLNQLGPFLKVVDAFGGVAEDGSFDLPPAADSLDGVPIYGRRVVVLTAAGRAPFVPAGEGRWRVNPALFTGARPGDVRVLTLDLFVNDEADPDVEAMERWLTQLDLAPWRPLLSR